MFKYIDKSTANVVKMNALLSCRWLIYMTQAVDWLKSALASGLPIWILPSGCHKMMTQF